MIFILLLLSAVIWAWLLVGRGAFWKSGPVLGAAHPTRPLKVTVVIPARDEAEHISGTLTSLLTQQFNGELRIVLVNDNSSDATGSLALELAETDGRLRVVNGEPLKTGWTGKMWAVSQESSWRLCMAPDIVALQGLTGNEISLADYADHRYVPPQQLLDHPSSVVERLFGGNNAGTASAIGVSWVDGEQPPDIEGKGEAVACGRDDGW